MDWLLKDLGYLFGAIGEEAQHLVSIDWYRAELRRPRQHHHDRPGAGGRQRHHRRSRRLARAPGDPQQGHLLGHRRRGRAAHLLRRHHRAAARHHRPDARRRPAAAVGLLENVPADHHRPHHDARRPLARSGTPGELSFWSAVGLITLADVSMSLDNVLAVAGAAKGSTSCSSSASPSRSSDGRRLALHRQAARQVSVDHLDRPPHHPLGGARHDLQRLARGHLQRPSTSAARKPSGRASCTDWG